MIENLIYVAWSGIRSMLRDREFDLCCVIGNSNYVAWSGIRSRLRDRKIWLMLDDRELGLCCVIGKLICVAWSGIRSTLHDREFDPCDATGSSIYFQPHSYAAAPWYYDCAGAGALTSPPYFTTICSSLKGSVANLRVHMTCFIAHDVPIWTGRLRSHEFQIWTYHRSVRHRCDVMYHYTTIGTFFGCRGPHGPLERILYIDLLGCSPWHPQKVVSRV